MVDLIDFIFHVDKYIGMLLAAYGPWTYLIFFLIIFCETGLVFFPFLPGDSLLFIAGAFAKKGGLDILLLFGVISFAAIFGDSVNYFLGKYIGEKFFLKLGLLKKEHLLQARDFYKKHGGKTIVIARFVPIIRTIAPFVAGMGEMEYPRFVVFNIAGALAWVGLFLSAGYLFGSIKIVEDNLSLVIIGVILVSLLPIGLEVVRRKLKKRKYLS